MQNSSGRRCVVCDLQSVLRLQLHSAIYDAKQKPVRKMNSRVPNLLLNNNLITQEQYLLFKSRQKDSGNSVVTDLCKLGVVTEDQISSFLSSYYDLQKVDMDGAEIPEPVRKLLSPEFIQKYQALPLKRTGKTLQVALVDPSIDFVVEDIKFITGFNVQPVVITETQFLRALESFYHMGGTLDKILKEMGDDVQAEIVQDRSDSEAEKLKEEIEAAPVVKLLDGIIADAVQRGASDVHIEPYETQLRIRFRIDGMLAEIMSPPYHMKSALISRAKIMANLNIAERRVPQDGHIKMKLSDRTIDLRVSTLPTLFGEKVVMRILDKTNLTLDLATFGFEEKALDDFNKAIRLPGVWGPSRKISRYNLSASVAGRNTGSHFQAISSGCSNRQSIKGHRAGSQTPQTVYPRQPMTAAAASITPCQKCT